MQALGGRRHQVQDGVQQWRYANFMSTRSHKNRHIRSGLNNIFQTADKLLIRQGTFLQVLFQEAVLSFGCSFNQGSMRLCSGILHVCRDIRNGLSIPHESLHRDQVNDTLEIRVSLRWAVAP